VVHYGAARRAVSSILSPYSSRFQETVQEISRCIASVDAIASTSGRAEIRGLTLSFEESEKKLHVMQLRMNELQAPSERTKAVVMRVLQVALSRLVCRKEESLADFNRQPWPRKRHQS
jgi:hypothetical protein